jgi:AcrR family transcriptional regulator
MTTGRPRRTQAERTAATRAALLDATFDSMVELGYGATTTTEVAHRAGVSLGALLHHFPTKAELLSASVSHTFDRRLEEFRKGVADLEPGADRLGSSLDLLWSMFSGPTFKVCVEMWVAARSDPALAEAIVAVDRRFMASSRDIFAELFPADEGFTDETFQRIGLSMAFALFDGLAFSRLIEGYDPYAADEVFQAFKTMAQLVLTMSQPTTPTGRV